MVEYHHKVDLEKHYADIVELNEVLMKDNREINTEL